MKFALLFITAFAFATEPLSNQEMFENQTVVVLGGTGYVGQEIIKSVLEYNPKKVIVLSRDEVKQFNLRNLFSSTKLQTLIGDIRDYQSVLNATKNGDIVFHVAALKRIDSLESNVEEAIKTNVIGSMNVFNACVANNVKKAIFLSTDKACLPVSAYGATKLLGEKLFTNYDKSATQTQFMAVRFGNISGSTGSVIPLFIDKIAKGQEILLTDPSMTRFLVDKKEAISLLFDALRYGAGGEIFIKPIPAMKISDLIDVLKQKLNATNPVKITGLRPGEKLAEVLISESEIPRTIEFNDCYIIQPTTLDANGEKPLYERQGKKMTHCEYSSNQNIASKEQLATLLQED